MYFSRFCLSFSVFSVNGIRRRPRFYGNRGITVKIAVISKSIFFSTGRKNRAKNWNKVRYGQDRTYRHILYASVRDTMCRAAAGPAWLGHSRHTHSTLRAMEGAPQSPNAHRRNEMVLVC